MIFRVLGLLLPSIVLLLSATLLMPVVAELDSALQTLLTQIPYILAVIVLLLGYGFNNSRIVFAALNLTACYGLIQLGLQTSLDRSDSYVLFSALSLILPVHFFLIALYRERGLLTLFGLGRLSVILISYLPLWLLWQQGELGYYIVDLPSSLQQRLVDDLYLSEAATWTFCSALFITVVALLIRRSFTEASLLTALIAGLVIITWFNQPLISTLFMTAALLSLATAVVQYSYKMAFIDELTGIPARRALQHKLTTLGKRYTLAMCDIDHFKQFNDTYGHDVGDQVLKMVAAKLYQVTGGGKAYRYGGEEFTLVFPGKTEQEALPYIEQLRETIANYPMSIRSQERPKDNEEGKQQRSKNQSQKTVSVTISIGICENRPELIDTQAVIKKADQALYGAKKNGRNCSVTAHYEIPPVKSKRSRQRQDYA